MADTKKSFVLHLDSLLILDELTVEQRSVLFMAIRDFNNGIEPELDPLMKICFLPFRNQFVRDQDKYSSFIEKQSKKGLKSAEKRKIKPLLTTVDYGLNGKPLSTDSTYNDSVNVSVSDSVKDSVSVKKKKAFIAPIVEDVIKYFLENSYSEHGARKAFEYYSVADWHDSKGNPVKNWKQKMNANWFKSEFKVVTKHLQTDQSDNKW